MDWHRDRFLISDDPAKLDLEVIHEFLRGSYWARGIPRELVARSIEHSLCFGIYDGPRQIGFARVITDHATFAYIGDVFVLPAHRGKGLAGWLMDVILAHPRLQGLRRWMLVTHDAHGLYRKFGFTELAHPERVMEISKPGLYERSGPAPST
jgi:GNAT superfamily N-acetyltransferase